MRAAARASVIAAVATFALISAASIAFAEVRSLKLFFTHTGERETIIYKRDGRYDAKGLARVNRLLRDWRRNEPARMDPRLLDLVWEVYQRAGARDYINIVSAYRSPATNNMLRGRSRGSGVAKNSQHTLGKAMDFYIPGVKLSRLREIAMQLQIGGVGYYPTSGSPFVHLDVGNVRAWPRMSRQELARIFPNGRTLHLPADGRALPAYDLAMADYRQRIKAGSAIVASAAGKPKSTDDASQSRGTLLTAMLPTRKSRALEAAALQIAGGMATSEPSFADLAAIGAPIPTFRPAVADNVRPLSTAAFVPSASFIRAHETGFLRQPDAMESRLTASGPAGAQAQWAISDAALLAWAFASAKELKQMRLPAGLQNAVASLEEVGSPPEQSSRFADPREPLGEDHLWSDG
ncbi:MAG: DUF882 domain-containing protein [Aquamicrobium sp.]|uniref:DUF882 domain-containing protein n=1 Tax=Mesorhizobium sp. Pch-S TaxID=2082387 RepID=UPI00101218AC|nr:DUF882 domain-containing protein [Mesorhizobium sp. Pch-S]MBR2691095.1 DUF882 domain-containing protein [Aquamicrobium sp.]QAZ44463.1 hypothetical protein C1M53_17490 [Mesorhizobium sp. Pch-S]